MYCTVLVPVVVYWSQWWFSGPQWWFTGPSGGYSLEVTAVYGIIAVTPVTSSSRNNAETSNFDLADLSKCSPTWKYGILPRARVNFRVTLHFLGIVAFSRNDRLNQARKPRNDGFGDLQNKPGNTRIGGKIPEFGVQKAYSHKG